MRLKLKLILVTALFAVYPVFSQDTPFSSMSVGIKASTLGYGLEVATPLHKKLALRLGINTTAGINLREYNIDLSGMVDDLDISFSEIPELRLKPDLKFTHANLLLDFHPAGIFHVTAGFFIGGSKFKLSGQVVDPNGQSAILLPGREWPAIEVGDRKIDLEGGRADIDLKLGKSAIKPYLGIGLGRAVPKNKVSFKFELGVVFQNGYVIKTEGVVFDFADSHQEKLIDIHDTLSSFPLIKMWPMVNFQLSYRIF